MKNKIKAALIAASVILTAVIAFDESNVVSIVARKALELIGKVFAAIFGAS